MKYDELISELRSQICKNNCFDCVYMKTGCTPKLCEQAADAIEKLQSQLPKWIPVTERLPENDKTVLVWNRRNSREYFDVYDHGSWIILESEDITNWMPLPEPPKEETDG